MISCTAHKIHSAHECMICRGTSSVAYGKILLTFFIVSSCSRGVCNYQDIRGSKMPKCLHYIYSMPQPFSLFLNYIFCCRKGCQIISAV